MTRNYTVSSVTATILYPFPLPSFSESLWKETFHQKSVFLKKNYLLNSFIYFWLNWFFIPEHGLSLVAVSRGYSSMTCTNFSLQWLLLAEASHCRGFSLQSMGSGYTAFSSCSLWAPDCGLRSCGSWAMLPLGMWDLPRPGTEPVSPVMTGGFLTTGSLGKSKKPVSLCNSLKSGIKSLLIIWFSLWNITPYFTYNFFSSIYCR